MRCDVLTGMLMWQCVGWLSGTTLLGELKETILKMEAAGPSETLVDIPKIHSDLFQNTQYRTKPP